VKPIKLSLRQWSLLETQLKRDYNPSVTLIRSKMRDKLGFTNRNHVYYDFSGNNVSDVYLDFFDDVKRTMFLLKYSEFITNGRNQSSDIE
jgi:hypothetical protein